jgi:hypothetical protein
MAKEGMRFTQHYSGAPVCAPSRSILMTGKHAGHSFIRGNYELGGFADSLEGGQMPLHEGAFTIAKMLKEKGYQTGLVGKWGMGVTGTTGSPLNHGFDYYYSVLDQKQAHNFYPTHLWENDKWDALNNHVFSVHGKIDPKTATDADFEKFRGKDYAPAKFTQKALSFIESNKKQAFFLRLDESIQQIENGQSSTFYSPTVKFTAAKKVAKLIQLDEKDAFDFGPQAELLFVQTAEVIQSEIMSAEQELPLDKQKTVPAAPSPADPKPILVKAIKPEPNMRTHFGAHEKKSTGKKWLWLMPAGALVLALVQFQPFLVDRLDALMGTAKPVEVAALTTAPVDATPATPADPASPTAAATPQIAPAITLSTGVAVAADPACPLPDASIENYKSPSASKPSNMVFVKMPTAQIICVEDGDGKVQTKTMEPGLGHSFYGKPPFKLLTSGLSSAEVFFQGFRARPSNADSKSIQLVQAD